jgi:hypothetical protein
MYRGHWLAFVVVFGPGCAPSEEEVQREFEDFVETRQACAEDSNCAVVSPGCPLGCFVFVEQSQVSAVEQKARELIDEYESGGRRCDYGCVAAGEPVCREGRCTGSEQ